MTKIYVSPSTQENNKGAGMYGTEEDVMNALATIIINKLSTYGYETERNKPSMSVVQVVEHSNNYRPDLHLALHSNGSNGKARGCEVFCYRFNVNGHNQAKCIYNELAQITPVDRGVKQGYDFYGKGKSMYEVAYTTSPSVLVEVGFHDNIEDAKWIKENLEPIASAIVSGINTYFNVNSSSGLDYKKLYEDLEARHNQLKIDIFELMQRYNK